MGRQTIWGALDPFYEHGPTLGRTAANAGFLTALLDADPFDAYHFYLQSRRQAADQEAALKLSHPGLWEAGKFRIAVRQELPEALERTAFYAFHLSDCICSPAPLARLRNALAPEIFPITATTHSISYADYGASFLKHLWPGTTPRDAVTATSATACRVVAAYYDVLAEGYGLDPAAFRRPRIERVPLGVDAASFAPADALARRQAGARLGFAREALTVLVFARIAHSSKMDPLPLLGVFRRLIAAGRDPAGLRLVLAGWVEEEDRDFLAVLRALAANLGLETLVFERPDEARKRELYAAADVFVSLVDNVQETFGLTVLEAMAAGLPVLASDFDGYKDLVLHGETGFLVPVTGPAETDLLDMLAPVSFDNHTHLRLAQETAPDVAAAAAFLERLLADPGLRAAMGRRGRDRLEGRFTWRAVIEAHLALWEALWTAPVPDREALRSQRHPCQIPYARVFAGYPTRVLSDEARLVVSRAGQALTRGLEHPVIYDELSMTLSLKAVHALAVLARKPLGAGELVKRLALDLPDMDEARAKYHVLWALKHDFLEWEKGAA